MYQQPAEIIEAKPPQISQPVELAQQTETKTPTEGEIAKAISVCRSSLDENDVTALAGIIRKESRKYDYDWKLILAIIKTESQFNARARSHKGARGLMQVLPSTAEWLSPKMGLKYGGRDSLYDPEYNIKLGTYYLHILHQRFGSIDKAIAAYNRGPNGLARHLRQNKKLPSKYLAKVMGYYKELKDDSDGYAS